MKDIEPFPVKYHFTIEHVSTSSTIKQKGLMGTSNALN